MKATEIVEIVEATIEAMDIKGMDKGFMDSVWKFDLAEEKLELWINAYESGGLSGIRALTENFPMEQDEAKAAIQQIHDFFKTTWPDIKYKTVRRQNRITIYVQLSDEDDDFNELCQIRYTPFDQKWHLYWKKSKSKWWPYVCETENVDGILWKTLYLTKLDYYGCFWDNEEELY